MIRFVVRQMTFPDMHPPINALGQAAAPHQQLHHSDAAGSDATRSIGELIVNAIDVEHRPFAFNEKILATEPPFNATLAVSRSSCDIHFHLKRLRVFEQEEFCNTSSTRKTPEVFEFSQTDEQESLEDILVRGLAIRRSGHVFNFREHMTARVTADVIRGVIRE